MTEYCDIKRTHENYPLLTNQQRQSHILLLLRITKTSKRIFWHGAKRNVHSGSLQKNFVHHTKHWGGGMKKKSLNEVDRLK